MTAPRSMHVRRLLLVGSALCALAVAGPGGKLSAQAFDGTPSTVTGSVGYDRATPGIETITVNSDQAVILWNPPPSVISPYVFLPAGNVATFQNGAGNTNFAVLNRIAYTGGPTRFDGSVISQLIDGLGTATRGGTILFQSPGGIIIGSAARFDVGNLVLTTLDVATNAAGDFFDPSGLLSLNSGGAFPNALVQVEPGAQILAPTLGSYVIMAAPRIDQGGLVQVNGSVAYIAATSVDLRVNAGLFDILINVGTDNATPIVHGGTTGGPASTGAGDVHRIYMVMAPSNQAITASLLGNIGYDDAVSASVENGQIVLSAGYQVQGGSVVVAAPPLGTPAADIQIPSGRMSSDLSGFATGTMFAGGGPGALDFTQDIFLSGAVQATLSAAPGQAVTVGGNASILSPGGQAGITANAGGTVAIAGSVLVDASAIGGADLFGDGTDAQGGQAQIAADGGAITINGNADVRAAATGGSASGPVGAGGNGSGGNASVLAQNNGSVRVDGNLSMDSGGQGGFTPGLDSNFTPVDGGTGSGGIIQLAAGAGNISIGATTRLTANGVGGGSASTAGGNGTGGIILIRGTDGTTSLTGQTIVNARGIGGFGFSGGAGQGGSLFVGALRGSVAFASAATANLSGTGGGGGLGGPGGGGTGGNLTVFADAATGTVTAPSLDGNVEGIGGAGGASDGPGGQGGNGQGGNATLIAATDFVPPVPAPGVRIGTVNLSANGQGGAGGDSFNATGGAGGSGAGGTVSLRGESGRVAALVAATLTANGTGAAGGAGGGGGTAATGAGGNVVIFSSGAGGLVSAPTLNGTAGGLGPALAGNAAGNWNVSAGTGGAMNFTTLTLAAPVVGTSAGGQASIIDLADGRLDVTGTGSFSTPLDIQISAAGTGTLAGGDLSLAANAVTVSHLNRPANGDTIAAANLTAQTVADFVANAGTSLRATNAINLVAGGSAVVSGSMAAANVTIQPIGNFTANAGSSIIATNAVSVTAGGAAIVSGTVSGAGVTFQSGGDFTANAGSSVSATNAVNVTAGGAASVSGSVSGSSVTFQSAGNFAANAGSSVSATNAVSVTAGGAASVSGSVSGSSVTFQSTGNFAANAGSSVSAANAVSVTAGGAASVSGSVSGSSVTFQSAGDFAANAGSSVSATNAVSVAAGGAASVLGSVSGSSVTFQSVGNFTANAGSSVSATNAVSVIAGGAASVSGSVLAPNVTFQASGNFLANAGSSIRATTALILTAGGNATFSAPVLAPAITVRSRDIDIGAGGFLGDANTQTVTLLAAAPAGLPFGQVVIGGAALGPGYTLTNAEAGRIRTITLNIQTAPTGTLPGRPPDLLLRDLTLTGSGGGVNILRITVAGGTSGVDGIAQVEGNVLLANAGAGDGIFLTAAQRLQIVTPQGSIRVLDAAGMPGGALTLTSNNIWSASQALIGQLLADVNFAGRNDALLANTGPDTPRGYIEAGGVTLAARDTLLVQNSGNTIDFAGITIGQGTLAITPTGGPLDVYAFGRRINPDGSYVTNKAFFGEVVYGGPGVVLSTVYRPDAAFNNCPILGALCRIPDNPLPGGPDPIIGPTGGSSAIVLAPPPADDLVDTSFSNDPLIEEPVTSGSENILWDCRDENRDGKCDGRHE